MRRLAHAFARRVLGSAYPRALQRWRRAQGAWRSRRVAAVTRRFVAWHGLTVSGGPFAGLAYPDAAALSLVPKLLGIYERELHGAIEAAIRVQPAVIVNVGAADGYYAVGLKRRCPDATVVAYEADGHQRDLLRRVAAANGVDVDVRGAAGPGDLAGASLIVMDCEGCERALLDPGQPATVVVELHDFLDPGVGEAIAERFAPTHDVRIVPTGPQPPPSELAFSEYRPGPMRWAVMTPRR
jgi:hypothetical protein